MNHVPACAGLPIDLLSRVILGLDVCSLCATLPVSLLWRQAASSEDVWRVAVLEQQVPQDPPGTYRSAFTSLGTTLCLSFSEIAASGVVSAALKVWDANSAIRRLAAAKPPSLLRELAHFVRRKHSGVEAEVLKVRSLASSLSAHVALEVLNFFPFPTWVCMCVGQSPADRLAEEWPEVRVFGFASSSASACGSLLLLKIGAAGSRPGVHAFRLPAYTRVEIGEHVFALEDSADGAALSFAYFSSLSLGVGAQALENCLDASAWGPSTGVLIPTTRDNGQRPYYPLPADEWEARGVPQGHDGISLAVGDDGLVVMMPFEDLAPHRGRGFALQSLAPLYTGSVELAIN